MSHGPSEARHWNSALTALLCGSHCYWMPAAAPPVAAPDEALRRLHWDHIWDAWELEAQQHEVGHEQRALDSVITPRGRPFWRVGQQPADNVSARGMRRIMVAGRGSSESTAVGAGFGADSSLLAMLRCQTERWFMMLSDENNALRVENAALKADLAAARTATMSIPPGPTAAPLAIQSPTPAAPRRLEMASSGAVSRGTLSSSSAELVHRPEATPQPMWTQSSPRNGMTATPSFTAQLFASIGRSTSPRDNSVADEEELDVESSVSGSAHSVGDAALVTALPSPRADDMHTCRVAAATCASSMAALSQLLQLRWGTTDEDIMASEESQQAADSHHIIDMTRPASPTPSMCLSVVCSPGSVTPECFDRDEDDDDGKSRLSDDGCESLYSARMAHLASLRDGAVVAAAEAVATSLRRKDSLKGLLAESGLAALTLSPTPGLDAGSAGDAACAAVRQYADNLAKAQSDADVAHWSSAAAAAAAASVSDTPVCAPSLAVTPMWQLLALSGGDADQSLAFPSDYWRTSAGMDAQLRTVAPEVASPDTLVGLHIEDSYLTASADGGLTADEGEEDDDVMRCLTSTLSVADAAAAHDEAAAAVAAALARVNTLPSPLELAASCEREAECDD
jgi:hypothetical protein